MGGFLGSGILDVAIGLILVYLIMSILASALVEAVNGALQTRAKGLEAFIRQLLRDPASAKTNLEKFVSPFQRGLDAFINVFGGDGNTNRPSTKSKSPVQADRVDYFYSETLVAATLNGTQKPSYIDSKDFALAVFDTIFSFESEGRAADWRSLMDMEQIAQTVDRLPTGMPLKDVMRALLTKANNDKDQLVKLLEDWFDSSMDRVRGGFKQTTQRTLVIIGIVAAALLNVDSIAITNRLLQNPALRAHIAEQAAVVAGQVKGGQLPAYYLEQIDQLGLPVGWTETNIRESFNIKPGSTGLPVDIGGLVIMKVLGILITGFAVSQGAPFWFDLLNKLTNIRSGGKPPPTASEAPVTPSLTVSTPKQGTVIRVEGAQDSKHPVG
jgi:hypothetical protein